MDRMAHTKNDIGDWAVKYWRIIFIGIVTSVEYSWVGINTFASGFVTMAFVIELMDLVKQWVEKNNESL